MDGKMTLGKKQNWFPRNPGIAQKANEIKGKK
jgi:hypothetical protein